jgi:hypothetical protein
VVVQEHQELMVSSGSSGANGLNSRTHQEVQKYRSYEVVPLGSSGFIRDSGKSGTSGFKSA